MPSEHNNNGKQGLNGTRTKMLGLPGSVIPLVDNIRRGGEKAENSEKRASPEMKGGKLVP